MYFNKRWRDVTSKCSFCIKYEIWEEFHNDMFPGQEEILEYLLTMKNKENRKAGRQIYRSCNGFKTAMDILQYLSWLWMPSRSKDKKKDTYWTCYSTFISNQTCLFFFCLNFLSQTLMIHREEGEGGGYLFNSSLPLPPASKTLRH